jgi:hypothetical protein
MAAFWFGPRASRSLNFGALPEPIVREVAALGTLLDARVR